MKITLPLVKSSVDDERLTEDMKKDFDIYSEIYVFKDEYNWKEDEDNHAFSVFLDYGKDSKNALMFEVDLDDLEMFASSILKSIKMLRRDYKKTLKDKINKGSLI